MSHADGLYAESLSAALSQTGPDAKEGLMAFLEEAQATLPLEPYISEPDIPRIMLSRMSDFRQEIHLLHQ